ncbi:hypothetical protein ACQKGD_09155 [Peribacillus frigoritolerans]
MDKFITNTPSKGVAENLRITYSTFTKGGWEIASSVKVDSFFV